jgi:DNA-binding MurR/RpiR family transcriptional regulator
VNCLLHDFSASRLKETNPQMTSNRIKSRVDMLGERYRARAPALSSSLQAVARYINDNREVILDATAMEIAAATDTSDATVVRAVQALGFAGLRDLKTTLTAWFGPAMNSEE